MKATVVAAAKLIVEAVPRPASLKVRPEPETARSPLSVRLLCKVWLPPPVEIVPPVVPTLIRPVPSGPVRIVWEPESSTVPELREIVPALKSTPPVKSLALFTKTRLSEPTPSLVSLPVPRMRPR